MSQTKSQYYIGIMSGTSLDAIDAILVSINSKQLSIINTHEAPLDDALKEQIRLLNLPSDNEIEKAQVLSQTLAKHFAQAALDLLEKSAITADQVTAIGCHGQTIRHQPSSSDALGYSLQIGNGAVIAELTGIETITDFRSRDIAAGGQGAPLVPAFHQFAFQGQTQNRAIINIGGMANITLLPADNNDRQRSGFDTGPGNVFMNHWVYSEKNKAYDHDGEWASSGQVIPELLAAMLNDKYFALVPPKSTGREHFGIHWLEPFKLKQYPAEDVQATLLALTAQSICNDISPCVDEIYLCGGGALNSALKQQIGKLSNKPTTTTDKLGINAQWVEAAAFAWFAYKAVNRETANSPSCSGAKGERILGAIYPA